MSTSNNLFKPIKVGQCQLNHRVSMAPLTRMRAHGHQPSDMALEYYAQRASRPGTLIITEATFISEAASGYPDAPGIYSQRQLDAWAKIFKAVHDKQSYVFVQLWALGRAAIKKDLDHRKLPYVSASNVPTIEGKTPTPHALTVPEIKQYVRDYVTAAQNAVAAGADGVELHSANGYLPDQFLHANTNKRTDEYGGSIENRARFTLEIIDALGEAVGWGKVGVRLSPWNVAGEVDPGVSPVPQWSYVLSELQRRANAGKEIAYVHVVEPRWVVRKSVFDIVESDGDNEFVATVWKGKLIRAGGYDLALAKKHAAENDNVLIAMGRDFIATPDLVDRWEQGIALNKQNRKTFYSPGPEGYIDYPFAADVKDLKSKV